MMNRTKQIKSLVKQELRKASRSKYVKIAFLMMPLFMWILQGGQLYLISTIGDPSFEGQTLYIANMDDGNDSINLGTSISYQMLQFTYDTEKNMYGVDIRVEIYEEYRNLSIIDVARDQELTPLIVIPQNFTQVYADLNTSDPLSIPPVIEVITFPSDSRLAYAALRDIVSIIEEQPFTIFEIEKESEVVLTPLSGEGEEGANNTMFNGFMIFLTIVLSVVAPAAYISSAITKEKEDKTLEALMTLPISSRDILTSKVIAGTVLISIYSIVNVFGMLIFRALVTSSEAEFVQALGESLTNEMILVITLSIFLSALVSMGVGIAVVSRVSDTKSAEGIYMGVMMVPAMYVGFVALSDGLSTSLPYYLIPWSNTIGILMKSMYPKTFEYAAITNSIGLDVILHIAYLLVFIVISLLISARLFNQEKMIL